MKNDEVFDTVLLIKNYEEKPTKNGGKYIDGIVEMKGSVQFKVWAGSTFDEMHNFDYNNTVCKVSGKVNEYNGTKSLILNDVKALQEGTYDASTFFEDKYNEVAYFDALNQLVKKNSSEEGYNVFSMVIADVKERFMVEFAAKGHHDAVKSGLLAHTYKNVYILTRFIKLYQNIVKNLDMDVLVVGTALHDVGKVFEYTNGVVQGMGLLVSHHTFGVEILAKYKDEIVALKDEEFYYRLLAVVEQHHGEFGETPRAIDAYLIHLVDLLESKFQAIDESLEKGNDVVNIDGMFLR